MRRLLPVRVRRLDEGHAHPRRRGELGPELQRHPRGQPEGAPGDPRARRAGRRAGRRLRPAARRPLDVVHGRRRHREAGARRARARAQADRRRARRQDAGRRDRAPSLDRGRRGVRVRQRDRLQGRVDDDRRRLPGRAGAARARLLFQGRRSHEGHPRGLRGSRRSHAGARRRGACPGRGGREDRPPGRDAAGARVDDEHGAARSEEGLPPPRSRRPEEARAGRRLGGLPRRHGLPRDHGDQRRPAGLRQGVRRHDPGRQDRRLEDVPALAPRAGHLAVALAQVRRRVVSVPAGLDRHQGASAAMEALRALRRRDDGRGPGAALRQGAPGGGRQAGRRADGRRASRRR